MATRKPVKKAAVKKAAEQKVPPAKRDAKPAPVSKPPVKRPDGPTARSCPLVLDGELDAAEKKMLELKGDKLSPVEDA